MTAPYEIPENAYSKISWMFHVDKENLEACISSMQGKRCGVGVTQLVNGTYALALIALESGGFDVVDDAPINLLVAILKPGIDGLDAFEYTQMESAT